MSWLATAFCDTCKVEVRKHHMARHRLSKGHIARAGAVAETPSDWTLSDGEFTRFLAGVRFRHLSTSEKIIYRQYKPQRRQSK